MRVDSVLSYLLATALRVVRSFNTKALSEPFFIEVIKNMKNPVFDLESDLQGTLAQIESPCTVFIPELKGKSKNLEFTCVWQRADGDDLKNLKADLLARDNEIAALQADFARYEGYLEKLRKGEDVDDEDEITMEGVLNEMRRADDEISAYLIDQVSTRLLGIKGLFLKNRKKINIDSEQIADALPAFLKWDNYKIGFMTSYRDSLDLSIRNGEKRKNSNK